MLSEASIFKTEVTVFFFKLRTDPKLANNVFIVFLTLSNQFYNSFTSNHTNMSRFGKLTDVVKKSFFRVVL